MTSALSLRNVTKRYSGHLAVDDFSIDVRPGIIYGILGPNGAGKSTSIRMTMNIIARDAGDIRLLDADPARQPQVLRRIGYLPEERGLYKKMKVIDTIVFFARLKGVDRRTARARAEVWLERMGLAEWRDGKIETLSKGMQQKVQFITTVLHEPELLILDEPFSGLDPVNQEVLRDTVIAARDEGRTVIFSTHIMEQAEKLCEEICIIAEGRKVLDGRLREVRRAAAGSHYQIEFLQPSVATESLMRSGELFDSAVEREGVWDVDLSPRVDPSAALARLNALDAQLIRFVRVEPTLHEIFVQRVGGANVAHRRPENARA
jgi:ABC-2 type transport system ATP-binding protein